MTTCREQSVYLTFPSTRFYRTTKKEKLIRRPQCHCRTFASSKQSHASPSPLHTPRHALHNSPASPLHTPRHTSPHETMPRSTRTQLHPHEPCHAPHEPSFTLTRPCPPPHETMPPTTLRPPANDTSPSRPPHETKPYGTAHATSSSKLTHRPCQSHLRLLRDYNRALALKCPRIPTVRGVGELYVNYSPLHEVSGWLFV